MPSKTYTEEFQRDAVALYENSTGASTQTIATDLGINRATLANWVKKYGTKTRATSPATEKSPSASVTEAEQIRQLQRENTRLRQERDILRKAAKYFAEETNW
ncbi:Transposase [Corynebacterium diphtheriae]|nr:Transposase [Corynebacterium diphtheriae] [Corynebacterium diphtheriae subsp. lausannense]SPJ40717.1 Transposase [Corynebacterium diphtheriae] [Corynebacterium diphtheriae subsp. lausannense]